MTLFGEREPRITVHTKPGCVQCRATIRALERDGLDFVTVDITADAQARDFLMSLGYLHAPVVMCGSTHWSGFRPDRIAGLEFAVQRQEAGLNAIPLMKLRHSNISRMRAAGIAADVVAAWHGHTERMTQAVYGRVTDDRLTAASTVFLTGPVGQN